MQVLGHFFMKNNNLHISQKSSTFVLFFEKNAFDGVTFWQFLYHISRYGISSDRYGTDTRGVA